MSTEHQQYSTENQADKIREYAARRGIEIIKPMRMQARVVCVSMVGRHFNS